MHLVSIDEEADITPPLECVGEVLEVRPIAPRRRKVVFIAGSQNLDAEDRCSRSSTARLLNVDIEGWPLRQIDCVRHTSDLYCGTSGGTQAHDKCSPSHECPPEDGVRDLRNDNPETEPLIRWMNLAPLQ